MSRFMVERTKLTWREQEERERESQEEGGRGPPPARIHAASTHRREEDDCGRQHRDRRHGGFAGAVPGPGPGSLGAAAVSQ